MITDDVHAGQAIDGKSEPRSSICGRWYADDTFVRTDIQADGSIAAIYASVEENDVPRENCNGWMAPGFVDIQVNGYGGVDYSGPTLSAEGVDSVIRALAAAGTTRHFPTIITNSQERICRNLSVLHEAAVTTPQRRAALAGFHVEGPYISSEDGPRGAHDPQFIRNPDWSEVSEWVAAAGGDLTMVTLAPERNGSIKLIERLSAEGIVPAIGHTAATDDEIRLAVDAGARISTHLGNGSHAVLPRLRNYLWAQLAEDRLMAGLITDGFHLPPDALRSIVRAKGSSRVILVSDAAPLAGMPPGRTRWGQIDVEVHQDGHVSLAGTPFLAGAGHLLDHNIAQAIANSDMTHQQAVESCTSRVQELFSLSGFTRTNDQLIVDSQFGPAIYRDLVRYEWGYGAASLHITHTIRNGELVYQCTTPEKPAQTTHPEKREKPQ